MTGRLGESRGVRRAFWVQVAAGVSTEGAAQRVGVSGTTGRRWFKQAGGMSRLRSLAPEAGRYLSHSEREEIAVGLAAGHSIRAIARALRRSPSTISREVRRNTRRPNSGPRPYRAWLAQRRAEVKAVRPKVGKLATNPVLRRVVADQLTQRWSPQQIAAWLGCQYPTDPEMQVSHETIYRSLYVQGRGELRRELTRCLRTGRAVRKPRRRVRGNVGRSHLPNPISISERPAEAADRAVPGHWEGDLIMGAHNRSAIGTLVERSTRYCLLLRLGRDFTAEAVRDQMITTIATLPAHLWRSLTWDRGFEMRKHADISIARNLPIYFCDPASPWQRGSNENTNGLLRQYFPKGTDLAAHSNEHLTPPSPLNSTAGPAKHSAGAPPPKR